jgi:HK97 family phage prohead protease
MPVPKPSAGEAESDYMSRCMGSDAMQSEFPDREQRVAVCMNTFRGGKSADLADYECNTMHVAAEIKAEEGDAGTFSGYGSIFGNVDLGQDVVEKGAFSRSIAKRGAKGIKLLYQHRIDEPIGIFDEIVEDERGLKVKGRLAMGTQRGREAYELMKMGALDGLSIGYRLEPKGYTYDADKGRRYLKEVDLMEISAVTFPMNPRARVSAVKGADWTVRQWESFLRDAGSLSRSEAKAAAAAVAKALGLRDAEGQSDVLQSMKRLQSLLTTR